jgi:signal transduction histidine kinase
MQMLPGESDDRAGTVRVTGQTARAGSSGWAHGLRRQLGSLSLKSKMALAMSLLFVLFVNTGAYLGLSHFERERKSAITQETFNVVSSLADGIDARLRLAHDMVIAVAATIPAEAMNDAAKAQAFLGQQTALHVMFDNGLFLVSREGRLIAESPFKPDRRGRDISAREFVRKTLETQRPYISKPYRSTHNPGEPALVMTAPVFDRNGVMLGLIEGSFDLLGRNFLADLANVRVGTTGYVYLTQGRETMISHPDRSRIMTPPPSAGQNVLFDRALEGFEGSGETVTSTGVPMLANVKRVPATGWILVAQLPIEEAYAPIRQARRSYAVAAVIGTIVMLAAAWLLMRRITMPLSEMTAQVEQIGSAEAGRHRLSIAAQDELGTLAQAFNRMLDALDRQRGDLERSDDALRRLNLELEQRVQQRTDEVTRANSRLQETLAHLERTQDELVQRETLASLGSLVAGIAHELNTPIGNGLTVATTLADKTKEFVAETRQGTLRRSSLDAYAEQALQGCALLTRNLWQAAELIANFKHVAVDQTSSMRRRFDLAEVIGEVVSTITPAFRKTPHRIELDVAPDIVMDSFPGPLGQVVINLTNNALLHGFDGIGHQGVVRLEGRLTESGRARLVIADNGRGIPAGHLGRIFDPFFTTKLGHGGSGLGLNIVFGIVTRVLGGRIEAASVVGQGTTFTLELPLSAPSRPEAGQPQSARAERRTQDAG